LIYNWVQILLGLFLSVAGGPASAGELRISHQFHAERDTRGRAAQLFAEEVMRRSPELRVLVHSQLSLGFTRDEQLEALQSGTLDFAVLPFVVPGKKVPELSLVLLPGLVPDQPAARALKSSQVYPKLQELAAANGLRIVTWWWMRGGFAFTAPRATAAGALAGLKLQSCGLMQELLAHAGAQLDDEAASEAPMLLDMGALDGVAMPYEEFEASRLHEHTKFATFGGLSLVTCFSPMLMSKKTWDRLSPKQKLAIEDAAAISDAYFERAQKELEDRARAAFQKAGAEVRALTGDDFAGWLKLARETVWARYSEQGALSSELARMAGELNSQP
jgi:TRAP-type C4-dicarboxylate transport system substrate-binding protein